ncbi:queuosine precursor transporter [Cellulophaga baltica]|uniref:queuosine precursor transporter n=1 Tax=Cellulophaga TaxID=104264 RepID=UPI001C07D6C6|nr:MULTISPECIES: queuosine precursor transporter [Cellulophaga]MBU2995168.1 queuosine precursor transporter [Cellulophaga baltica]MDO6766563.1 queuosine precursor transporter [Cellulophaga sp. 1_MG-2023]
MTPKDRKLAFKIYLFLAALFITSLVVSNLIFQKFFYWKPFGDVTVFGASLFEVSVGILPYPITFLITDIISEIYGRKKANQVVTAGIFASFFSMGIILLANYMPAIKTSPIDNKTFNQVFALSPIAVFASMIAYLIAQYIDVAIYHFWKKVTNGKHLWLRNNFSTFLSQIMDTVVVVGLLCVFKVLPWDLFSGLVISGVIFKIIVAFIDTPFLYLFVYIFRKRFGLDLGGEIELEY